MSIYAISDLHLSFGVDKPMDVFGPKWHNYMDKLKEAWGKTVAEEDTVLIPGDISWGTYLDDALEDFRFINELPGKKIISKGNHDYWWTTYKKLNKFLNKYELNSISFLYNNSFYIEGYWIYGTRGWKDPEDDNFDSDDLRIFNRELVRLNLSLKSANDNDSPKIAMIHYPPVNSMGRHNLFAQAMSDNNTQICVYGHLHYINDIEPFSGKLLGVDFKFVSAEHLEFKPVEIV